MRWLVVLVLLLPTVVADGVQPPLEAALATLQPSGSPYLVEALVSSGIDPRTWPAEEPVLGRVTISGPPGIGPLREVYALASAGVRVHDDAYLGSVDLLAFLEQNGGINEDNDAIHSFTILSYHALGVSAPVQWTAKLLSLQDNGTWGCGPGVSMACTGFAVAALASQHALTDEIRASARNLVAEFYEAPGNNAQPIAWAINIQHALGDEVSQQAWDALFSTQASDGRFTFGGQPNDWATHEAIVAMTGGHPVVAGEPRSLPGKSVQDATALPVVALIGALFLVARRGPK